MANKQKQTKKNGGQNNNRSQRTQTSKKEASKSVQVKTSSTFPLKHIHRHVNAWGTLYVLFMFAVIFALMLSSALALGIGQDQRTSVSTSVKEATTQQTIDEPVVADDGRIEALNGVLYEPATMFYPIAVMFDNHSLARPQSHLQSASVVYETLVEGSITRFMGIFDHGDLDKVGPIRSARPYFVQWVDVIDAGYMHAGGSPEALQKINEYSIKNIYGGQYYYRDYSRQAPHNLYTNSDLMKLALRDYGWDKNPQNFSRWEFADDPEKGAHDDGGKVHLAYSGNAIGSLVEWEYVPETQRYKRFQAGVSHEDTSTAAQLTAKTIVVQRIPPIVAIQDHGRLVLDILGEGRADILFDGKRIEGTWKKPDVTTRTTFYDENGEEVIFPRGTIFVEVIPTDRDVTFE